MAGVGIGLVETAEHAAVATFAPETIRGSAFGFLAAVQSFGNLAASVVVGVIYTTGVTGGGVWLRHRRDGDRARGDPGHVARRQASRADLTTCSTVATGRQGARRCCRLSCVATSQVRPAATPGELPFTEHGTGSSWSRFGVWSDYPAAAWFGCRASKGEVSRVDEDSGVGGPGGQHRVSR